MGEVIQLCLAEDFIELNLQIFLKFVFEFDCFHSKALFISFPSNHVTISTDDVQNKT